MSRVPITSRPAPPAHTTPRRPLERAGLGRTLPLRSGVDVADGGQKPLAGRYRTRPLGPAALGRPRWSERSGRRRWPGLAALGVDHHQAGRIDTEQLLAASAIYCREGASPCSGSRLPKAPMILARSVGLIDMALRAFQVRTGIPASRSGSEHRGCRAGQGRVAWEGWTGPARQAPPSRVPTRRNRSWAYHWMLPIPAQTGAPSPAGFGAGLRG